MNEVAHAALIIFRPAMIHLKKSFYSEHENSSEYTYAVYGDRYSVTQGLKKFIYAYLLPALFMLLIAVLLSRWFSQQYSYLVIALACVMYLCLSRLIYKQGQRIIIDKQQGLLFKGQYYDASRIRALGISRLKTPSKPEGSNYISVVLPEGEKRLSPYINKDTAKDLLQALQTRLPPQH